MSIDFESIHNHNEQAVLDTVQARAPRFPALANNADLLADVACVALNRLPPRYIRHRVDMAFYESEGERQSTQRAVEEAVERAFAFVQARVATRARA